MGEEEEPKPENNQVEKNIKYAGYGTVETLKFSRGKQKQEDVTELEK